MHHGGMSNELTLPSIPAVIDQLIVAIGGEMAEEVRNGLEDLKAQAMEVALQLRRADLQNLPMSEAVNRWGEFPLLAKLHHGIQPFLCFELNAEQEIVIRDIFRQLGVAPAAVMGARTALFHVAAGTEGPERYIARFLAYEGARLNLMVATWDQPAIEAAGLLRQFDETAEALLATQIEEVPAGDESFSVFVAQVMLHLFVAVEDRQEELVAAVTHVKDDLQRRTRAIARARTFGSAKNAVLRNDLARDNERKASRELADIFPEILATTNHVDKVRSLLPEAAPAQRRRVIDLLREGGDQ